MLSLRKRGRIRYLKQLLVALLVFALIVTYVVQIQQAFANDEDGLQTVVLKDKGEGPPEEPSVQFLPGSLALQGNELLVLQNNEPLALKNNEPLMPEGNESIALEGNESLALISLMSGLSAMPENELLVQQSNELLALESPAGEDPAIGSGDNPNEEGDIEEDKSETVSNEPVNKNPDPVPASQGIMGSVPFAPSLARIEGEMYHVIFYGGAGSDSFYEYNVPEGTLVKDIAPSPDMLVPIADKYNFIGWYPAFSATEKITSNPTYVGQWTQDVDERENVPDWNSALKIMGWGVPGEANELEWKGASSNGKTGLDHAYYQDIGNGQVKLYFLASSTQKRITSVAFAAASNNRRIVELGNDNDDQGKLKYAVFELTLSAVQLVDGFGLKVLSTETGVGQNFVNNDFRFTNVNTYIVEYYTYSVSPESAILRADLTEIKAGIIGSEVTAKPISIRGYEFDAACRYNILKGIVPEKGPRQLVLKLYYNRGNLPAFNVKYDVNGGTSGPIIDPYNPYFDGDTVKVLQDVPKREGYTFTGWLSSYDKKTYLGGGTFIMPSQDITLVAQWTLRTDLSYTVNYLEQGTNKVLSKQKVVSRQIFGAKVTESAIDIEGYTKVAPLTNTITIAVDGNVINFYYTARTDLSYTVNYLEQGTNKVLYVQKVVDRQTFGKTVTENAIDIAGYNKVAPTTKTITIAVSGNVINFYYTARADLSYTVNYLEQGTNKVLSKQKVVDRQIFGKTVTENAIDIAGYNKVAPTSITITIDISGNEINFYYTVRTDLSYTVNYLEQGSNRVLSKQKIVDRQTFGTSVTENAVDITGYDKVAPTTKSITIAADGNVINFYYTARTGLSYTVNYLEQGTDKVLSKQKAVDGQTFGTTVTENAIDITGYNKVAPTTKSITIAIDGNVINFYYTARTDLSYTVNYLEQGTDKVLSKQKVVDRQTFGTTVTENAIDITGYDKAAPSTKSITIAAVGNVINFYYTARTGLSYTVNYLEQGTDKVLSKQKVVVGQTFGTTATENAIDITGYNKVAPAAKTITIAVDGNVINFYYTARTDLSYTVNYLEQGTDKVLSKQKLVDRQTFGTSVTENAIDITGYDKVAPATKSIIIAVDGNVINFYYKARSDLSYTVNYLEQGTDKVLSKQKLVDKQIFGTTVTENAVDIMGYDKAAPTTKSITIAVDGNVINFYYTARIDLSYTVNYLEQGTNKVLSKQKQVDKQTFGTEATESAIDIAGYNKVEPVTKSITIAVNGNVINFYYTARSDLSYKVNYLEQGTEKVLSKQKVVEKQTFGTTVTENAIDIEGYNKVAPATKSITIAVEGNVINFYYTARTDLSYKVNYLEQGTDKVLSKQKVVDKQTFGTSVTENAIDIAGYNKVEPTTKTLTIAVDGNVINFYYTARTDLSYKVNYLEQGTDKVLSGQKVADKQIFGTIVTENAIDIEGYNKVAPATKSITIAVDGNVINFYYTARTDLGYKVNYLEQGTNKVLSKQKVVDKQTFGTEVTENAIDIEGYNKAVPTTKSITIAVDGNVINFYYTARTDLNYTVNYLEQGTDKVLSKQKIVDKQIFGTEVTENAIDIVGYNKVVPTSKSITIAVEGNVINFYYTARTDLSYTVNYLEQGTDKVLSKQKVVDKKIFGTEVTENAIDIEGYNKAAPTTKSITIAVAGNVINFYYTARTDLSYKVNYLEQGTDKVLSGQKVVDKQTFGVKVTENAIDIEGYDKVVPTTKTITIAVEGNVINFYYTARTDLSYTVNYLEKDTDKVLSKQKLVEKQTFDTKVTETAIDITGYNKVEPTSKSITIAVDGNVINFYYTARTDLSYTVNYLEQGTGKVLSKQKIVEKQTFGTTVTEKAIDIEGYNKVEPATKSTVVAVDGNVINFYYTARTDLSYTVNYLEQGTNKVLSKQKIVDKQTFGTEATENAIDIEGYNKAAPMTKSITIAVDGNVINFYYTARTDLSYIVNYLEQGTDKVLSGQKVVEKQTFGTVVTEKAIDIEGYNKAEPTSKSITIAVDGNVINFYYTARTDLSYTVNYLEQGTNKVLSKQKIVDKQTFGTKATENAIDIEGYDKAAPTTKTITIAVDGNVINFYYTARTDLSYTVNYLEQDTDKVLSRQKQVDKQTFGTKVTENAIDIEGYNKVAPAAKTITIAVEGNEINFYYTARTDLSYTVNYLEQDTDMVLSPQKAVDKQTFGTKVTETAIDIEGYDKVEPVTNTITIAVDGNVINFYYTARTDLSYSVNYLERGTDTALAEQKEMDQQIFGTKVTENAIDIEGYDKLEPAVKTITIAVEGNVISFYYKARTDLSYAVNYLEQDTNKVLSKRKVVDKQTYGTDVTENAINIPGYNKVEPAAKKITIAVDGNVINFYYTAIKYTVRYLPGAHGAFAEQVYEGLYYGDSTPVFSGGRSNDRNWRFDGWSPAIAGKVTGNAVYVAQWARTGGGGNGGSGGGGGGGSVDKPKTPAYIPPVVTEPEETPVTNPPVPIVFAAEEEIPLAPAHALLGIPYHYHAWALLNLLLTIITGLTMVALFATYMHRRKDDNEGDPDYEQKVKKYLGLRLFTIAATFVSVILFILTENPTLPMIFYDKWTIWHILITAMTILLAGFSLKKYEEEELGLSGS